MERMYLYFIITLLSAAMAVFYIQRTQKDVFSIFSDNSGWINEDLNWSQNDKEPIVEDENDMEESIPDELPIEEEAPEIKPAQPQQPEFPQPEFLQPEFDNAPEQDFVPRERRFKPLQRIRNLFQCLIFWR
jgi:hypothetical protein